MLISCLSTNTLRQKEAPFSFKRVDLYRVFETRKKSTKKENKVRNIFKRKEREQRANESKRERLKWQREGKE